MDRIFTLCFHGLGGPNRQLGPGESDYWLSEKSFLAILDSLPRDGSVRLTFDDGNDSDVHIALPALVSRGLSASFFIVADFIGVPGFVSAADIRTLHDSGMTIGSHGMRHRRWRGMDRAIAHEEIVIAPRIISSIIGQPVTEAACPFGAYDWRSLRLLKQAGFGSIHTSYTGASSAGQWLVWRNTPKANAGSDFLIKSIADANRLDLAFEQSVRRLLRTYVY